MKPNYSKGHECPVCKAPGVPFRFATCRTCWPTVPVPIQQRVQAAWSRRGREPRAHREALAELLHWARDAKAVRHG